MQKKYIKRELALQLEDFKKLKKYRGQVLKYVEICNILSVPMYGGADAGGQQQVNHMSKMARFGSFKKVKNGYKVESIYLKEHNIAKKRKRRCKYADATKVLQYNLSQMLSSYNVLSKNKALELSGYVNENYNIARQNIEETAKILGVELRILENFFAYFGNKMKMNFIHTIKNAHAIKSYSKEMIVAKGGSHCVASVKDREKIDASQEIGLRAVGCKTVQGAFMKGKKVWKKFQKVVKENLEGIDYYYNGYKIQINRKAVKTTERTYLKAKANMQALVEESILKSLKKANAEESYIVQVQKLIDILIKDTTFDLVEAMAA